MGHNSAWNTKYNKVPAFDLINQWKKYLKNCFPDYNNGKYKHGHQATSCMHYGLGWIVRQRPTHSSFVCLGLFC